MEVKTTAYFDGPDDVESNALFGDELEEAVKGMLPESPNWRKHCYVDYYEAPAEWMEGSSLVTINNGMMRTTYSQRSKEAGLVLRTVSELSENSEH